ncbi:MAG: hypothetical protein QOK48_2487 [Blastocatellia bacterium]|jgi:hypothetical protein|nr:hypothetical protein [Blastocatellia bacterium]
MAAPKRCDLDHRKGTNGEPRSRGFPEGFLDQPFYGWVIKRATTASPF